MVWPHVVVYKPPALSLCVWDVMWVRGLLVTLCDTCVMSVCHLGYVKWNLGGLLSIPETQLSWKVQPPCPCSGPPAPSPASSPNLLQPLAWAPVWGVQRRHSGLAGRLTQSLCKPINSSLSPADSQAKLPHSSPQQQPALPPPLGPRPAPLSSVLAPARGIWGWRGRGVERWEQSGVRVSLALRP